MVFCNSVYNIEQMLQEYVTQMMIMLTVVFMLVPTTIVVNLLKCRIFQYKQPKLDFQRA